MEFGVLSRKESVSPGNKKTRKKKQANSYSKKTLLLFNFFLALFSFCLILFCFSFSLFISVLFSKACSTLVTIIVSTSFFCLSLCTNNGKKTFSSVFVCRYQQKKKKLDTIKKKQTKKLSCLTNKLGSFFLGVFFTVSSLLEKKKHIFENVSFSRR